MSNVVERIQAFNQARDARLVSMKYQAMSTDAFAFLRGTCHLFYEDWPTISVLNNASATWICGDLHMQNLGSYKADNRLVYFGINDFDEAALAPCTWDLARFLTSVLVGAPTMKIAQTDALTLCKDFLAVYARTVEKAYVRLIDTEDTTGVVKALLAQVQQRHRRDFLNERTKQSSDGRKLVIDGKRTLAVSEAERTRVTAAVEASGAKQMNPSFFKVLDVAHRIAGVGSLGVNRYVILVEGKGSPDQNYLLDLKEQPLSSLQPYLKLTQPQWANQAARVATIQRWMQGISPALLVDIELQGYSYVLHELQPMADRVNAALLMGEMKHFAQLVKTIANVVACSQLRSAGRQGATTAYELIDFACSSGWHKPLLKYVQSYAKQVQEDYHTFVSAYGHGKLA